jgi:hypothetical protein
LTKEIIGLLCSIIRETGASDSAAAARASLHPSTVSRWKRDNLDFAILLRAAREDFRHAQLEIIQREAQAGGATGLRAAMWLLERIFPEDYAPRARERAQFQEQFEAAAAREVEGGEMAPPDRGEPLQNVQNLSELASVSERTPVVLPSSEGMPCPEEAPAECLAGFRHPGRPLQNVQNTPLAS